MDEKTKGKWNCLVSKFWKDGRWRLWFAVLGWVALALVVFTLLGELWIDSPTGEESFGIIWRLDVPSNNPDIIRVVLTAIGGFGGIVYLVIRYRERTDAEAELTRKEQETADRRLIDAVQQLGSESPQVRIAGVYAIADVADTYLGHYKQRAVDILAGYLRTDRGRKKDGTFKDAAVESTILKVFADHLRNPDELKVKSEVLDKISVKRREESEVLDKISAKWMEKSVKRREESEELMDESEVLDKISVKRREESEELMDKSQALKKTSEELMDKSQALMDESEVLDKISAKWKAKPHALKKELDVLKKTSAKWREESEELMDESQALMDKSQALMDKSQALKKESEELKKTSAKWKEDPYVLKKISQELMDESQALKKKSQALKKISQELMDESQALKKKSEELKKKNPSDVSKVKQLQAIKGKEKLWCECNIDLHGAVIHEAVDFSFLLVGEVNCSNTVFLGCYVDFMCTSFAADASFRGASFPKNVHFFDASFAAGAHFEGSKLQESPQQYRPLTKSDLQWANLSGATFSKDSPTEED